MKKIKFKMSIKELSFEYEGDQETGQNIQAGIQRTLGSLAETQNRIAGPSVDQLTIESHVVQPEAPKVKSTRTRRPRNNALRSWIIVLRGDGFFDSPRAISEVALELAKRGHNVKSNKISATLLTLVQKDILTRDKNSEGNFVYKKGPNNDVGGSSEDAD